MGTDEGGDRAQDEAEAAGERRSGAARWAIRVGSIVAGLAVGLAIAELAFSARDDGAFPHLSCYVADAELGAALEPGATTRVAFQGNPTTDVAINAAGFRGPDWGAPREDEILVVGDSQAFGLGVEYDQTFAAVLGELTDRPVIDAGVPTYGPLEYTAVARRLLEERHPSTIVYAINMANDFFEHSRPNPERHAVWDGWAVRAETAPHDVTEFPGRRWLFSRSHAFYALRRWLHDHESDVRFFRATGFESEGTLRDLLHESETAAEAHDAMERAHEEEVAAHHARLVGLEEAVGGTEDQLDQRIEGDLEARERRGRYIEAADARPSIQLRSARGHPGDIVAWQSTAESAREVTVTATMLNRGVRLRRGLLDEARGSDEEVGRLLEERERLRAQLAAERAREVGDAFVPSVLEPRLREVAELAREHGAELVVVALPLDVAVSEDEFAKYGAEPVDMTLARTLLRDLVATTERLGVRAVDPTEALRAAETPFLDGDLHLSPVGHRVVAETIRDRLAAPAPLRHPRPGLPDGRSAVPEPEEFLHAEEILARGSSAAGCATDLVREWLRVACRKRTGAPPTGVELVEGGHGEALTVTTEAAATLLAPFMAGDELVADFHWSDRTQRLTARWPEGAESPTLELSEPADPARAEAVEDPASARLCECHEQVYGWTDCRRDLGDTNESYELLASCGTSCEELYGAASVECMRAHAGDCDAMLRCARGERDHLPPCDEGRANALGTGRCLALCRPEDGEAACEDGTCVAWQGADVCAPSGAHGSGGEVFEPPAVAEAEGGHSERPTVASFGGETCRVEEGERVAGESFALCAREDGVVVASYAGAVFLDRLDASGARVGERVQTALPESSAQYRTAAIAMGCGSPRDVLAYIHPCSSGYCLSAVVIEQYAAVGEPIDPIPVGGGMMAGLAVRAAEDGVWVAFGSVLGSMKVERWTPSASGAIERTQIATLTPGLPRALAVDGERWALVYDQPSRNSRLVVDGGEPVEIQARAPAYHVSLEGERVRVHWQARHGTLEAISAPPREGPLRGAPLRVELPDERLPLSTVLRPTLYAAPTLAGGDIDHLELRRLSAETGAPVARPIELPASDVSAFTWLGDRAFVLTAVGARVIRCE